MTENLRLTFAVDTTLTPATTDITANWQPGVVTETNSTRTKWADFDPTEAQANAVHSYTNGDRKLSTTDGEEQFVGNYYNWYTATAGTYFSSGDLYADKSICPKGFTLPTPTQLRNLIFTRYGYDSSNALSVVKFPISLILSGHYNSNSLGPSMIDDGSFTIGNGIIHDNRAYLSGDNNRLTGGYFNADPHYGLMWVGGDRMSFGFSIRCIAR